MESFNQKTSHSFIRSFVDSSIFMLEQMFLSDQNMFCFRGNVDHHEKLILHDLSARYSIISCIGLLKANKFGFKSSINPSKIISHIVSNYLSFLSYGDIGLILWADSIGDQSHSEIIWEKLKTYDDYFFGRQNTGYSIMDVAWILMGMSYYFPVAKKQREVALYCHRMANILKDSFIEETALFAENSVVKRKNVLAAMVQNRISSFASQIYPVAALAVYSRLLEESAFSSIAEQCADRLCRLQGQQGQWPWLYNCKTGTIADGYPVYSVHQGGMAPFALFELQQTLKTQQYLQPILKGLHWLEGDNELNAPLFGENHGVVWRGIQRRDSDHLGSYGIGWSGHCDRYLSAWMDGLSLEGFFNKSLGLEVLQETRPYEYGWYLWAFSDLAV